MECGGAGVRACASRLPEQSDLMPPVQQVHCRGGGVSMSVNFGMAEAKNKQGLTPSPLVPHSQQPSPAAIPRYTSSECYGDMDRILPYSLCGQMEQVSVGVIRPHCHTLHTYETFFLSWLQLLLPNQLKSCRFNSEIHVVFYKENE